MSDLIIEWVNKWMNGWARTKGMGKLAFESTDEWVKGWVGGG